MEYNEQVILKSLCYSSIFAYPLTKEELWKYAISEKSVDRTSFFSSLTDSKKVFSHISYYSLISEKHLIEKRIKRNEVAKQKLYIAKKTATVLSRIPTVLFIGISGSLSMMNTKKDDDIDLFIITKKKSVWITRILVLLVLQILGKRRKRTSPDVSNTVCVNLLIEETHLALLPHSQNLYTAHEVAQVKPLYNRNNIYEKFIAENRWVKKYLPNAIDIASEIASSLIDPRNDVTFFISFFNQLAKKVQLWYMKKHRTSEIITDGFLSFYSGKTQKKVLDTYKEKIKVL